MTEAAIVEYFFAVRPSVFTKFGNLLLIGSMIIIAIAFITSFFVKKLPTFYRKLIRKSKTLALWYAFVIILLYFFRYERVPYLSMRLWLWLWTVGFLTLSAIAAYKEWQKIPARKTKTLEEEKNKRYQ